MTYWTNIFILADVSGNAAQDASFDFGPSVRPASKIITSFLFTRCITHQYVYLCAGHSMSTLTQNANMNALDCKSCPYFFVLNQHFIFDADLQGSPAIHPGRDIQYSQVRPYSHHDHVANAGEP